MAIFRIEKNKNYSVMSNHHLHNKELSWKAKGLLSFMLSCPDDWDFSAQGLTVYTTDGITATNTTIRELEQHGYVKRTKVRDKGKIISWDYEVHEEPQLGKPQVEKPQVEKPQVEKPQVENLTQLSTNSTKDYKNKDTTVSNTTTTKDIATIVEYLNAECETSYRASTKTTIRLITALLKRYAVEEIKLVIAHKASQWLHDKQMMQYLRPNTLFGNKFEGYLQVALKSGINVETVDEQETSVINYNGKVYEE